jgi:low molecular weight protein-tyrosine phosphatase
MTAAGGEDGRAVRLLFVCLGNICRSPTAEGVMRELVRREGLQRTVLVDSAGTGSWHVGSPPDARAREAAAARGLRLAGAARQVAAGDFEQFDLLLAMDAENAGNLRRIAPDEQARGKVRLLREFDPASGGEGLEVPDPYYGAAGGFGEVLDLVEAACAGLLAEIRSGRAP